MFNNARILITGGTGSFGKLFVKTLLEKHSPKEIIVYSRDEMKQWEMRNEYLGQPVRFFIGDVRDQSRLSRACTGVDYIVHAAALKIVPTAELYPEEYIRTNIEGAVNVIQVARKHDVKRVVALSTDKACSPVNLYGATKLCSDKLFVSANFAAVNKDTRYSVVRYGNVMGSRGSVIPFFLKKAQEGVLPITDKRMTRYMITLEEGVELVLFALQEGLGGEIFVKKIPSMGILDIAKALAPKAKLNFIGIRPGEKLHEHMISAEDATTTLEFDEHYSILPHPQFRDKRFNNIKGGKPCEEEFTYSSNTNKQWMKTEELAAWVAERYGAMAAHEGDERSPAQPLSSLLERIVQGAESNETRLLISDEKFGAAISEREISKALQMVTALESKQQSALEVLLVKAALKAEEKDFSNAIHCVSEALKVSPENQTALSLFSHISSQYHRSLGK